MLIQRGWLESSCPPPHHWNDKNVPLVLSWGSLQIIRNIRYFITIHKSGQRCQPVTAWVLLCEQMQSTSQAPTYGGSWNCSDEDGLEPASQEQRQKGAPDLYDKGCNRRMALPGQRPSGKIYADPSEPILEHSVEPCRTTSFSAGL